MRKLRMLGVAVAGAFALTALPGCFYEADDHDSHGLEIETKPGKIEIETK